MEKKIENIYQSVLYNFTLAFTVAMLNTEPYSYFFLHKSLCFFLLLFVIQW